MTNDREIKRLEALKEEKKSEIKCLESDLSDIRREIFRLKNTSVPITTHTVIPPINERTKIKPTKEWRVFSFLKTLIQNVRKENNNDK